MPTRTTIFTTIRTEGTLLPADLLQRISEGTNIDGLTPESYHRPGEKLNEAINRSWNALQGAWASFKTAQGRLPTDDLGTSITRERWLLPLFRELDYGRLQTAPAVDIDGRTYPISHRWEQVPLHLVSYKIDLDKRTPGATGASNASPHSLLQVFLNRSEANLWGFLSNGYRLRILRDNASLTRQAFVEFDLEAMMTGEVYSDFVLLWLLAHQSRLEGQRPSDCWLEKWMKVAEDQGTRALDQLRNGVESAITALGLGFLEHPANSQLRDKLQSGALDGQDYYRQLLRLVYRLLFLFVAEDRNLLLDPAADEPVRDRYIKYYSTQRLRHMAEHFKGTRHPDLFESLRLVMRLLSGSDSSSKVPPPEGEGFRVGAVDGKGLALLPLGSFLFSDTALADIITCQMSNAHLLDAIRALSLTYDTRAQAYRSVDYRNLGPEELGSIYESLLELHPQINIPARRFALATAGGNERKTTGSYYTPTSLINALLDSALDPVLEAAIKGANALPSPRSGEGQGVGMSSAESRILALKICDPACGSGHFLIAAANRIAKALATVRTGEEEPPPAAVQEAKRDVIGHCIYGVDINPMAVELCKVNLWMEALEPGKPLSFLDHRIQVGNSLLGTTPALMANGIPDDAFTPIEGDDPKFVTTMKKLNRDERKQRAASVRQLDLFGTTTTADYRALTRAMHELDSTPDDTLAGIRRKEAQYAALASDPEYVKARLLADAWCAAFVWEKKTPRHEGEGQGVRVVLPLTDLLYRRMEADPLAENLRETREYIVELTQRYQFFHWHIAFPDVFTVDTRQLIDSSPHLGYQQSEPANVADVGQGVGLTGWIGGFDCVLGNPPWERIKIQEQEWFAERAPEIANASNAAARRKAIAELAESNPYLLQAFADDKRKAEGESHFIRISDRFPLCGRGDVNTYTIFAETSRQVINGYGRVGIIVPSGIATDDTTKFFFQDLMQTHSLANLYDFENRDAIFDGVHRAFKFSLVTMTGHQSFVPEAEYVFFALGVNDLKDDNKRFTLSADDIHLLNPNTGTTATFRSKRDAEIVKSIYRRNEIIFGEGDEYDNSHQLRFTRMFDMNKQGNLFEDYQTLMAHGHLDIHGKIKTDDKIYLPLIEGKTFTAYDHRFAVPIEGGGAIRTGGAKEVTLAEHCNPYFVINRRLYINERKVNEWAEGKLTRRWTLGFMNVTSATNHRTMVAALLPDSSSDYSVRIAIFAEPKANHAASILALFNSFSFDYIARQKLSGLNFSDYITYQIATPTTNSILSCSNFIVPRVLELTYTAWDLQPFAQDVGYDGPPFIWDDERRFLMRCELDALYFHLYQINRADVDYIMETFPIVKRKDEAAHGSYRTKDTILAMYDQMNALPTLHVPAPKDASATYPVPDVSHWQTWLTPPPASPAVAHPPKATS